MKNAVWQNGTRKLTGRWEYHWPSDRFVIELDSIDRVTSRQRHMIIAGDSPEWGNWKLVREK